MSSHLNKECSLPPWVPYGGPYFWWHAVQAAYVARAHRAMGERMMSRRANIRNRTRRASPRRGRFQMNEHHGPATVNSTGKRGPNVRVFWGFRVSWARRRPSDHTDERMLLRVRLRDTQNITRGLQRRGARTRHADRHRTRTSHASSRLKEKTAGELETATYAIPLSWQAAIGC